jgi:hydrogenase/urease accessory protein HupE
MTSAEAERRVRPLRLRGIASWCVCAMLALRVLAPLPSLAHALDPVLFELTEREDGKIDVRWKAPSAKMPGMHLVADLPPQCHRDGDASEDDLGDATVSRWVMVCDGGLVGKTIGIEGLETTDALVRITLRDGSVDRRVLGAGHPTVTVVPAPTRSDVFRDYARLGMEHIASGIDHLLFVFGLLLLTGGTRQLFATITAFTIGHSVTLALSALQIISVPQGPAEVVIAFTIYVLAVELARDAAPDSTLLRRRPWAMAFSFGLLHGLSFAGALKAAGLPDNDVPMALLSFNVGIEIGQVIFVVLVLAAWASLDTVTRSLPRWSQRIPVYAMGTAACFWVLSRAAALI